VSVIGNPILLSGGNKGGLFNFPISISSTEPTAEIEGHIWIDTTRGSNITSVHIVDKPTIDLPNNSLIFEVIDTRNTKISLIQDFKVGNSGVVQMLYETEGVGNHPWLVNSDGENKTYLAYPRVFTKIDNVLYLETAYVWTGTYWMLLSQADTYLFSLYDDYSTTSYPPSYCPIRVYNIADATYTLHDDIAPSITDRAVCVSVSDANGMYVAYQDEDETIYVYKRVGDTFTLYFSMLASDLKGYMPEEYANYYHCELRGGNYANYSTIRLSANGEYLAATYLTQPESSYSSSGYMKSGVLLLKNNGTTFVYHNNFDVASVYCSGGSNGVFNSHCALYASDDFSVLLLASSLYDYESSGTSSSYTYNHVLIGSPDSYTIQTNGTYYASNQSLLCALSKDGSCAVMETEDDDDYYYYVYSIDKNSNSIKNIATMYYRSSYQVVDDMYISSDNHIWLVRQSNSTTGEAAYLEHGKVENGVFTKLNDSYIMTNGNGQRLYTSYNSDVSGSSYVYYDMCMDIKNNLLYIATRYGIYVCDMVREDNGKLSSYTLKTTIPVDTSMVHRRIAITPDLTM
jgi:hypothetical protein